MRPVLFLDFDGPLFPETIINLGKPIHMYPGPSGLHPFISYWEMSTTSVKQLNALYDIYKFDTVVSSSWKDFVDKNQVEELFLANRLNLHLHNDWCTSKGGRFSAQRVHEISWWLEDHLVENLKLAHIILDDPWSGSSLLDNAWKELKLQEPFIIDPNVGIDPVCFKNMRSVVNEWANNYSSRTY